ncbi:MAG: molybdopterin-dependent oxidoreductase [Acidimicrobiales bacterium]|nr:molybdopterin-dependent oxidoreductase [Acidimicrobiaceae bacterium]MXV88501.1 molybdopterin-dependent oxidoreductase [Acidimicrobiales bacterium]MCY3607884.1 molybdopterin-dependent oxidoreductase [Acidimicrobiaceae bacterium]MDE0676885.1 molybdopterin-dependent oxidoreductase [Acidimicrobiaceae bacterium]MXX44467.1 molybdopterin-dependent oxidoreductase [Acidimicrobiales bacterium]
MTTVRGHCPLDCPDTCSWVVTVEDGRAVRLRGDRKHPVTRGGLCVKVNSFLEHASDPRRILHPLRRVGRKGDGEFERITWEDAIEEIATRWRETINVYGAEAIWPYYGTGSMGMIQGLAGAGRRLWNVLGTSQHQMTICTIAGGVGTGYTIGHNQVGMDPETLRHAKLVLLWGTNTLSTNLHLWPTIREARRNGAMLVVIDPVRTRTAEQADIHLAPQPGTDAALALGLLNVVLRRGAEDTEFIAKHTVGWQEFRARIVDAPPSRVAEITGLGADDIETVGTLLAERRPTGIRLAMGMQRHPGGGMAARTITCIPGVTGDWGRLGGGACYDTRGFFGGSWDALWRDDLRPEGTRHLSMTRLAASLLDLDDPPVKDLFVYNANPVASNPDQRRVRDGLARGDLFVVVSEHFHTDTTAYADIVLPATMQTEHADLQHSYGHLYLSWNEPAVDPPGEAIPNSELFRRLAGALGLEHACLYESDEDLARAVLDSTDQSLHGIDLEYLKRHGWSRLNYPEPFVPFAEGFPTPSGKLEFFSERMAQAGLDPVPGYMPAGVRARSDHRGLVLISAATHNFLNSTFANSELHRDREGAPTILVNAKDAMQRGLENDSAVFVFNDRGGFAATLRTSGAVPEGVAATTKGHWPANAGGSNANATVDERDSDMGGGAVFHDNVVQIEPLTRKDHSTP